MLRILNKLFNLDYEFDCNLFSGIKKINNLTKTIVHYLFLFFYYLLSLFLSQTISIEFIFRFLRIFQRCLSPETIIYFPFLYCLSSLPEDYDIIYKQNYEEFRIRYKNIESCKGTIFYVHGGGFISGDFAGYGDFCNYISNKFRRNIVFPQYRLNNIDFSIRDIIDSYNNINDKNIVVIGDSAGGYLVERLLNSGNIKREPNSVILISPVVDLNHIDSSDCMIDKKVYNWIMDKFNDETKNEIENSNISKMILYSNNECLTKKIEEKYYNKDNLYLDSIKSFHSYPLFWRYYKEGKDAVDRMVKFVNSIPRNYKIEKL